MRRILTILALALALLVLAAASALAGFDVEAFRRNIAAGMAGRPNQPGLKPQEVHLEAVDKAADFAGTEIYVVKGQLAPKDGQAQPFLMFVSADGRFFVSDIVDMGVGKSILKDARDRMRAKDLKDFGHKILDGAPGKPVVIYVSDPFCPYCRQAFAYLLERGQSYSELRLAHLPLTSHPGADIACAIMAWAEANAPQRLLEFVRFAYAELPIPSVREKTPEALSRAWNEVAGSFLARFPELKTLGADSAAVVAALASSRHAQAVAADMAKAASLGITGTPVVFVGAVRVTGFDQERLDELLK